MASYPPPTKARMPGKSTPEQQAKYLRRVTARTSASNTTIGRASTIVTTGLSLWIAGYSIFVADWGEKEHVFSEPRRWLDRQKQRFWTLSPEEQAAAAQLHQSGPSSPDTPSAHAST